MNDVNSLLPFGFSLICLIPAAIVAFVLIWRTKDIQAGVRFFLMLSVPIVAIVFFTWLMVEFLPENIFDLLFTLIYVVLLIFILVSGSLYWFNVTNAGKPIAPNTKNDAQIHWIAGFMFFVTAFTEIVYNIRGLGFLSMLIFANLLGKKFLAFQIREKGIVSRGRLIKFADVHHMEWADLRNKEKANILLANSQKPIQIKIPWEMIIPVDDYIKKNFARV